MQTLVMTSASSSDHFPFSESKPGLLFPDHPLCLGVHACGGQMSALVVVSKDFDLVS